MVPLGSRIPSINSCACMTTSGQALTIFLSQGVTSLEVVTAVKTAGKAAKQWTKVEEGALNIMAAFFQDR